MFKETKITAHDKGLIIELAKEGLTASRIGVKFGLKAGEVVQLCDSAKVKVKYNRRKQENPELEKLIKSGKYSANAIAAKLRICCSTVRAAQASLGLTYLEATKKRDSKIKQVTMLRKDGMPTREACQVIGVPVSSYNRLKALV